LLADARTAIAAGQIRTAEIHLKNLLQRHPDDATARALLGDVLLADGDVAGAEQSLRRAVELGAPVETVELSLLRALVLQGKHKEAIAEAETAPELPTDQQRIAFLQLKGAAYRAAGQRDAAEAAYREALLIAPKASSVRTDLAATLLELGRADEARTLLNELLADEPKFAAALLLRATIEAREGRRTDAEATLLDIVATEREHATDRSAYSLALAQLVELELALGKVTEAGTNADTLLAMNPANPAGVYLKASVEVQQGNLNAAKARLEAVVATSPRYWPAHRLLGAINIRQNQLGQAVMYLRTAVTNNPSDSAARLQLAEAYIRQGDVEGAKILVARSQDDVSDGLFLAFVGRTSQRAGLLEQASTYFEQSEKQAPKDLQQLIAVADLYMSAGEYERAIRVLENASTTNPVGERLTSYLIALLQVRQGDLKAADATAERLQQQLPKAAWPLNLRGMVALVAGDYDAARALLLKAVDLEPRNVAPLLGLAKLAVAQNDKAGVQKNLERVVDIEPSQPVALLGLAQLAAERGDFTAAHAYVARVPDANARARAEGEVLAREGRFDEAATVFGRVFSLQPSEPVALRAYETARRAGRQHPEAPLLAWNANHPRDVPTNVALGTIALAANQQDEAVRRYEAVIAVQPSHAVSLNNLAWLYGERGDPRALDVGERARASDPGNPSIADTLGWLYIRNGAAAKALPLLEQAAAGLRDQREVRYHLAVALADTGAQTKALEILEPLLAGGADFPGRDDAAKKLAALRAPR